MTLGWFVPLSEPVASSRRALHEPMADAFGALPEPAIAYLRRGVYGTAIGRTQAGENFARLRKGTYARIGYGNNYVGQRIYVKLLSFNSRGGGKQSLADVPVYSHVLGSPPANAAGLLSGIIQGPDVAVAAIGTGNIALNAATGDLNVSTVGPISLTTAFQSLVSGTLTIEGPNTVQFAYNMMIGNGGASAVTVNWKLTVAGLLTIDSGSASVAPGATVTVAKQASVVATNAGPTFFDVEAEMATGASPSLTAALIDLSAVEIRR